MSQRIVTIDTVRAMTPLLQRIGEDLVRAYDDVAEILPGSPGCERERQLDAALQRAQTYVAEFEQLGGTVRSYSPVCVEFLGEAGSRLGTIAWRGDPAEPPCFQATDALCEPAAVVAA